MKIMSSATHPQRVYGQIKKFSTSAVHNAVVKQIHFENHNKKRGSCLSFLTLVKFLKDEVFILFKCPADAPFSRKDEEIVSAVVLNPFGIGIKCE